MHQAMSLFHAQLLSPFGHSTAGGSGLNDAGFQIMSKQSTAQGRAKKPDKRATGGTPDEQAPAARTSDAPNMEVSWPPCWGRSMRNSKYCAVSSELLLLPQLVHLHSQTNSPMEVDQPSL